jgi:DNA-binding NarL/FixJ family response regulator
MDTEHCLDGSSDGAACPAQNAAISGLAEYLPSWGALSSSIPHNYNALLKLEASPTAVFRVNGLQATRQILKAAPATKVLMLSAHSDDVYIAEATNSGAVGYLVKQTAPDSVCSAIREVQKGNTFFSPPIPIRLQKRSRVKQMD